MDDPKVRICHDLPEIGISEDPIVLFNGSQQMMCYETKLQDNHFAVILFRNIIESKLTPINDEGLGKHKYAKYGMKFYSIHEIENVEETLERSISKLKYWVFCFKDRTFEVVGSDLKVIEKSCERITMEQIISDFIIGVK